jgi:spore germination protein
MKRVPIVIIMTIFQLTLLSGCWDQAIIENVGIILMQGVELSEDDRLLITDVAPVIGSSEKNQVKIVSMTADNPRESREIGNNKAFQNLSGGKTQEILFSEEMAKRGVHDIIEIFERDPSNPALAYVVVVEGSPKELVEKASKVREEPLFPMAVHQMLEQNIQKSQIPETRICTYDIDYYADGIDPVTPMIRLEGDEIVVSGSALFAKDKMVGKIGTRQTELLLAMMDEFKPAEYTFKDEIFKSNDASESPRKGLNMLIKKADLKIKVGIADNIPEINISMKFSGYLSDYTWDDLDKDTEQSKLEGAMTNEITRECNELVQYLQSVGSDPIGFGDKIEARDYDYWGSIDWKEVYKTAKIDVDAVVTYEQNGVIR